MFILAAWTKKAQLVFRHDGSILIQVGVGLEETVQNEPKRRGIQCGTEA
jgi:hypothetical protein